MRLTAACLLALSCALVSSPRAGASTRPLVAVGYSSADALHAAVRGRARIIRVLSRLRIAEVHPFREGFAADARRLPGIRYVEQVQPRISTSEPALFAPSSLGTPYEWQFAAAHADRVPESILRAAGRITIAVIDTGADLAAPDLAAKQPRVHNVRSGAPDVRDVIGHGTFVASLAGGSVTNGEGMAGFGGDAKLLVIKASGPGGAVTDVDEANGIIYAVDRGARVINLSVGGTETSETERRAIEYAAERGSLVVAAIGNEYERGNPVEYPAALLQPVGSNGTGGSGLSVGASTRSGARAVFSNTGSHLSLVAPGENVFGAISSAAGAADFISVALPGSSAGRYGFGSGTSFSTPEVAGAAALVMAANPLLKAAEVATLLEQSASNGGSWNPATGFGILDVGAAVARAENRSGILLAATRSGALIRLSWSSPGATTYRLSVRAPGKPTVVLLERTTRTSAAYGLARGPRYTFTVTALDRSGGRLVTASSIVR